MRLPAKHLSQPSSGFHRLAGVVFGKAGKTLDAITHDAQNHQRGEHDTTPAKVCGLVSHERRETTSAGLIGLNSRLIPPVSGEIASTPLLCRRLPKSFRTAARLQRHKHARGHVSAETPDHYEEQKHSGERPLSTL